MRQILKWLGWKISGKDFDSNIYLIVTCPLRNFYERFIVWLSILDIPYFIAGENLYKDLSLPLSIRFSPFKKDGIDPEFYKVACGVSSRSWICFINLNREKKEIEFVYMKAPFEVSVYEVLKKVLKIEAVKSL